MQQELLEALLKAWKEKSEEPLKDFPGIFGDSIDKLTMKWIIVNFKDEMSKEQKQLCMDSLAELVARMLTEWGFREAIEGTKLSIKVL